MNLQQNPEGVLTAAPDGPQAARNPESDVRISNTQDCGVAVGDVMHTESAPPAYEAGIIQQEGAQERQELSKRLEEMWTVPMDEEVYYTSGGLQIMEPSTKEALLATKLEELKGLVPGDSLWRLVGLCRCKDEELNFVRQSLAEAAAFDDVEIIRGGFQEENVGQKKNLNRIECIEVQVSLSGEKCVLQKSSSERFQWSGTGEGV
jgi:hypothetical protein